MKGDFSRIRFNPVKQYTAVLEQQGRVALDADANEQCAIDGYLRETETFDVVGQWGAPVHDAGFEIGVVNNKIVVGAGRYYVDGLVCENLAAIRYDDQPLLLDSPASAVLIQDLIRAGTTASIRVFLQAWQRLATALDDPCFREPALGQADTTARLQTVHRVVAMLVQPREVAPDPGGVSPLDQAGAARAARGKELALRGLPPHRTGSIARTLAPCCQAMYETATDDHTGTLAAQTSGGTDTCGCQPVPAAGYRGLENQLYRVEIHQGGDEMTATFKWSRENGSVVVAIQSVSGADVTVASLGPDANLGFQVGQWVEISDDADLFGLLPNQPGRLYQIKNIVATSQTITMTTSVVPIDPRRNARLRRWDQVGAVVTSDGVLVSGSWIDLENGIQVRFGPGKYFPGDYWVIPARTATGQIEWPPCDSDGQMFQQPHYPKVRTAPLACIHYDPSSRQNFTVDDCRLLFYPLTELTPPPTPSALHITNISWANDDVMPIETLVEDGLKVTFDHSPDGPVTPGNFIVTLEVPFFFEGARNLVELSAETPARTLAAPRVVSAEAIFVETFTYTTMRDLTILDSTIIRDQAGNTLRWIMPFDGSSLQRQEVLYINKRLAEGMLVGQPGRMRVKLLGHAMFTGTGTGRVFLDGQAFGQPAMRADGTTARVDLQLPSGNGQKTSDFESWFYLYPAPQLVSVLVAYTDLTVRAVGGNVIVTACTPPATPLPTAQQATITLLYPPLVATAISLSFAAGPGNIVALPPVTVPAGQPTVTVPLKLLAVPAQKTSFTLAAHLSTPFGDWNARSQPFTITPAPPVIG
jgi:hypothetical protein